MNKKHQINIFVGSQSYILRTNSVKEIEKFSGLKNITAKKVADFLSALNNQVFAAEYSGTFKREERSARSKPKTKASQVALEMNDGEARPAFVDQIIQRLGEGKQAVKKFNEITGFKIKSFGDLSQKKAQEGLMLILRGNK